MPVRAFVVLVPRSMSRMLPQIVCLNAREGICCFGLWRERAGLSKNRMVLMPVRAFVVLVQRIRPAIAGQHVAVLMPVRAFVVLVRHPTRDAVMTSVSRLNAREGICCFGRPVLLPQGRDGICLNAREGICCFGRGEQQHPPAGGES